jgi:cell division protein FtsX
LLDPRGTGAAMAGFALLAALATLAAAAAFVLGVEAQRIEAMARSVTVAVADTDPAAQANRAAAVATMMRERRDLEGVRVVEARRIVDELGPWIAPGEAPPAMIDVTLLPGNDERPLRRALAGQPGIAVFHEGASLGPLATLLRTLDHIAGWIGVATLIGMALIAALTARTRIAGGEETLALLDRLGASGPQVALLVRRPAFREALFGSLGGLVFGLIAMLFIAGALRNADVGAVTAARIPASAWAILAGLPPLCVGIAVAAAQAMALLIWARRR